MPFAHTLMTHENNTVGHHPLSLGEGMHMAITPSLSKKRSIPQRPCRTIKRVDMSIAIFIWQKVCRWPSHIYTHTLSLFLAPWKKRGDHPPSLKEQKGNRACPSFSLCSSKMSGGSIQISLEEKQQESRHPLSLSL